MFQNIQTVSSQKQLLPTLQKLLQKFQFSTFICNQIQSKYSQNQHFEFRIYKLDQTEVDRQQRFNSRIILLKENKQIHRNQTQYFAYLGIRPLLCGGSDSFNQNATEKIRKEATSNKNDTLDQNLPNLQAQEIQQQQKSQQSNENNLAIDQAIEKEKRLSNYFSLDGEDSTKSLEKVGQQQCDKQNIISKNDQINDISQGQQENQILNKTIDNFQDQKKKIQEISNDKELKTVKILQDLAQNLTESPFEFSQQISLQSESKQNNKQQSDTILEFLHSLQRYSKRQTELESRIKFYNQDIILLEKLGQGGQGEVQVGYNKKTQQKLAIKRFLGKDDITYKRERNMYQHVKNNNCSDLFFDLLEYDDDKKILVMERGMCNLRQFAQLRRQEGSIDGPLTAMEILIVMEYVAIAMQRLWRDARLCHCDTKEENILIYYYNQGLGGYKPILTDLGAAYCILIEPNAKYATVCTPEYFDDEILSLKKQNAQLQQINAPELQDTQIVQSEIYTLGRTIQSLLQYCLPQSQSQQVKDFKQLFKKKNEIVKYLGFFENSISSSKDFESYTIVLELIRKILVEKNYQDFNILVKDIQDAKLLAQSKLGEGGRKQQTDFLADNSDFLRDWQKCEIADKSDFHSMKIDQLYELSEHYHQYDIYANSIAVNQKLYEELKNSPEIQLTKVQCQDDNEAIKNIFMYCQVLKHLGMALRQIGDVDQALKHNQQELYIREHQLMEGETEKVADCHAQIGQDYLGLGQLELAIQSFKKELQIKQKIFGDDNLKLAITYKNFATLYINQGKLEQALEMLTRCLKIQKAHYGKQNLDLATTQNNIGEVYMSQGKLDQALEMFTQSLKIMKAQYGENNSKLASIYINIGSVYAYQGKLEQSLEMYTKCLNIQKIHYGHNNFNLAATYNNIGGIYIDQGKPEQALEMYKKSHDIQLQHYGDKNFNLSDTYNCLGHAYHDLHNLEQSLEMYRKCLDIQKAHYGKNNFKLATTYNGIGILYRKQGKLEQALEYYKKSLQIRRNYYGENHFNLATAYSNIGSVYQIQGKLEQALEEYNKCLNIEKAHYGENNLKLAGTYSNIGLVYHKLKRLSESLEMFKKCLEIQKHHYEDNNYNLAGTYLNLSKLLQQLNTMQESLEMAQKAYDIFAIHCGQNHQNTLSAQQQCQDLNRIIAQK